jgi:hypothetical protein
MSDVLSSLGKVFKSPAFGPIMSGATLGVGEIGNLLAGRQTQNAINTANTAANTAAKTVTNVTPEQIAAEARRTAAPLDQALTQGITNQVSGDLASRGLSQAPGILASTESQALAPLAYQNYQAALQAVMQKLGLNTQAAQQAAQTYIQTMPYLPKGQNLTPAMMLFLQQLQQLKNRNANTQTPPTFPDTGLPQGPPQFPSPPEGTVYGPPTPADTVDMGALGVNPG